MLTDAELDLGGYRFSDLQKLRIITNRTDLHRKQAELGFPRAIKTGSSQAWFSRAEVHAWIRQRAALRDAEIQSGPSIPTKGKAVPSLPKEGHEHARPTARNRLVPTRN